jgi:protocatechuate 3,4-dioxygenase beta subunit
MLLGESKLVTRRRLLLALALAGAVPGAFAEELMRTPRQTPGPFYPDHLPLDTDNDLLIIDDALTRAVGDVTQLSGRVIDVDGRPVRGALVEIWQVDHNGVYLHSDSANGARRDSHFQGFGRFETGSTGEYRFRTIKPVPYANRTPHIHFAVRRGADSFTTQCYVAGEPRNDLDFVLNSISDPKARASVIVPFRRIPESPTGELAARFDIVLSRAGA